MRGKVLVLLGLIVLAIFPSCNMGNRNVISQERIAEGFNGIKLDGVGDINVRPGANYKVIVTTDSNLQDRVLTTVNGNVLLITQKPGQFNASTLTVDVYLPDLKNISLNGAGKMKIFNGNSSELVISLSGTGSIDAQDLQVHNITINHSGVGNSKIWATDSLNGTLSGVGNILYKGSPTINVKKTGVGNIRPL
ncbi:MAG: DUF2807 domain-containing protein [Treponema sp.]|nr:DUF2807 domain-containing protein [Treponema sp.]